MVQALRTILEIILEIVSGVAGLGALYLLFGRRLKFSGQKLPWYGFKRLPNGDIDVEPELVTLAGLILFVAAIAIWAAVKSSFWIGDQPLNENPRRRLPIFANRVSYRDSIAATMGTSGIVHET
jgi:hypothetical protein